VTSARRKALIAIAVPMLAVPMQVEARAVQAAAPVSAAPVPAALAPSVRGTWELDAGASAHERVIGETVVIGGDDTHVTYSATVRFNGKVTGARFAATVNGPDVPLMSLTGKVVGRARVRRLPSGRTITEMMPDAGVHRIIEHRVSIDGKTLLSLLYDPSGTVLSILVFRRTA
jgi:hypothetical protein